MVAVGFSLLAIIVAVGTMMRSKDLREKAADNIQGRLEEHRDLLEQELNETLSAASAMEQRIDKADKRSERLDRLFRQRAEMAQRMDDEVKTLGRNCQVLRGRIEAARGGYSV